MSKASPNFNPTSWTIVLEAADSQSPSSTEALAKICETYWHPLYFHIRRNRISQEDAADLIQGFFLKVIQNGFLKAADQSKGKSSKAQGGPIRYSIYPGKPSTTTLKIKTFDIYLEACRRKGSLAQGNVFFKSVDQIN